MDHAAAVTAERAATVDRVASLARQVDALAEQQALTTHDDEHDPEGVTIGYERAQLQGRPPSPAHESCCAARHCRSWVVC